MIDLHSHHTRCGHADDTLEAMARAAANRGATVFGFSDHAPLFAHQSDHPLPGTQMARSQWPDYLAEARGVRNKLAPLFPRMEILVGTEADWIPGTHEIYEQELTAAGLDYALVSVHDIGDVHVYKRSTHDRVTDTDQLHRDYWRLTREAVQSGLFDILAHMDAIKARLPRPRTSMETEIEATLDCIADHDMTVEVNSAGLRKTTEFFPSPRILQGLVRRGVSITFGSDSHRVAEVGHGYEAAAEMLASLGVTELAVFRERERFHAPLRVPVAAGLP